MKFPGGLLDLKAKTGKINVPVPGVLEIVNAPPHSLARTPSPFPNSLLDVVPLSCIYRREDC